MEKVIVPKHLPGPGKPSPMSWELVPELIKATLTAQGCSLLHHWKRRPHHLYVRFQYAPLVYQGDLFYLQRWAAAEWGISPSQIIFPRTGWPCTEKTLRNGSLLSQVVRDAVVRLLSREYMKREQLSKQRLSDRLHRRWRRVKDQRRRILSRFSSQVAPAEQKAEQKAAALTLLEGIHR